MVRHKVHVSVTRSDGKIIEIPGGRATNKLVWIKVNTDSPEGSDKALSLMVKSEPHTEHISIELEVPKEFAKRLRIRFK